jgi:hypothetical protein
VPPEEDVGEFISTRTGNPVILVARMVRACRGRPVARYRYMSEVSEEVRGLIKGLTEANPDQRLSVTQLCQSAYIAEAPGLIGNPFSQPPDAVVAILKDPSDV